MACSGRVRAPSRLHAARERLIGRACRPLRQAGSGRGRGSGACRATDGKKCYELSLEEKLAQAGGKVVVIDNYDSFTYNLCQYLGDLKCPYIVFKNDEATTDQLRDAKPSGILISPGPGTPEESGMSLEAVEKLGPEFPLFGVCLGHQCIGQIFGGNIIRAKCGVMHGKTSPVFHKDIGILKGLSR